MGKQEAVSHSSSSSASSSWDCPPIVVHGLGTRSTAPLESALLGEFGDDSYFILTVVELPGTPPSIENGTAQVSIVFTGGKFYQVRIRAVEEPSRAQRKRHKNNPFVADKLAAALAAKKNAEAFTDEDGDFDYIKAGWPVDVWQMGYGKVVAPVVTTSR